MDAYLLSKLTEGCFHHSYDCNLFACVVCIGLSGCFMFFMGVQFSFSRRRFEKMESHDQTGCQTPECPMPCINNCGFLGWASMMNMCSKCYKDALLKQEQEKLAASCIENIMNGSSSGNGKEPVVTESVDIQAGVIESEIVSIESSSISSLNKSCHSDKSCRLSMFIL